MFPLALDIPTVLRKLNPDISNTYYNESELSELDEDLLNIPTIFRIDNLSARQNTDIPEQATTVNTDRDDISHLVEVINYRIENGLPADLLVKGISDLYHMGISIHTINQLRDIIKKSRINNRLVTLAYLSGIADGQYREQVHFKTRFALRKALLNCKLNENILAQLKWELKSLTD